MGWQEYFDNLHNLHNPNWGNNPMGPLVENSEPGTSSDYLTPPEGEAEAETSGADADTEEVVEDLLQDELNSPVEETCQNLSLVCSVVGRHLGCPRCTVIGTQCV